MEDELGTIEAVLGRGSFGTTYRVRSRDKLYAIKALPVVSETDDDFARAEIATLEMISKKPGACEYTVCYVGTSRSESWRLVVADEETGELRREGEAKPYRFIYMDYVDVAPMADFVSRGDYDLYLGAAMDLVEGLILLHEKGIYHRDVKLDNIVYDRQACRAKYIDFGLTCAAAAAASCVPGGSPAYQHPQRAPSVNENSIRDDKWGLGAALFELCHGGAFAYDEVALPDGQYQFVNFRQPSTPIPELNAVIATLLAPDLAPGLPELLVLLRRAAAKRSRCVLPKGKGKEVPLDALAEDILGEDRDAFARRLGTLCAEQGAVLVSPLAADCRSLRYRSPPRASFGQAGQNRVGGLSFR